MEVSIIALVGVLLSVGGSLFATSRQLRHDKGRAALEYQHLYLGKLYDRRIETYPELYCVLSDLAKALRTTWTNSDIEAATRRLVAWDSANALFVSPTTAQLLIELRHELWRSDGLEQRADFLLQRIGHLESALRTEIGVFDSSGFHKPDPSTAPTRSSTTPDRIG